MPRPSRHVFVCTNERPGASDGGGKPSCGAGGRGAAIAERFAAALMARPALWDAVSVTACGCLGPCFDGPTVVVYPDGTWYARVRVEDVDEIVTSHLEGGRPVERLRYRWPD